MVVLGLDIGGANLKAATADRRAISVPFALWKQPDRLPAALADLIRQFPDATELAIAMTGELCDCFETKRQGVNAILDAVEAAANGRPVRVWSTAGKFLSIAEARQNHRAAAAANWHALATFAGRFAPHHAGLLIDIGSTSTDIIPLRDGLPETEGLTDPDRLRFSELAYIGIRRTPVFAVYTDRVCAEYFATTQDVFVALGDLPEDAADADTANGRPLTRAHSLNRLARVLGGDREEFSEAELIDFAGRVKCSILQKLASAVIHAAPDPWDSRTAIVSGAGEFLAREVLAAAYAGEPLERTISLNDILGPAVSACAPAYALAVLAAERPIA